MREKRTHGTATVLCVVVGLALGLGACTDDDSVRRQDVSASRAVKATTTPPSPSSSPSLASEGESKAIATYRAMWEDAAAASRTSDPKHPRLDDHAKGNALSLLRYVMKESRKAGVVNVGAASVAPAVVKSSEDSVELLDCVDGSKWVQAKPSDSPGGMPGGHYRTEATVVLKSGKWMVSELYSAEAGTCME